MLSLSECPPQPPSKAWLCSRPWASPRERQPCPGPGVHLGQEPRQTNPFRPEGSGNVAAATACATARLCPAWCSVRCRRNVHRCSAKVCGRKGRTDIAVVGAACRGPSQDPGTRALASARPVTWADCLPAQTPRLRPVKQEGWPSSEHPYVLCRRCPPSGCRCRGGTGRGASALRSCWLLAVAPPPNVPLVPSDCFRKPAQPVHVWTPMPKQPRSKETRGLSSHDVHPKPD